MITEMTGEGEESGGKVTVTPEGGDQIFWGRGRCFTCHSVGEKGNAVRGPNLGQFGEKYPLPIGARAEERAKMRFEKTGVFYSATDYLVESLAEPSAYVVSGFKNEMAIIYSPPISLSPGEVMAVVSYLQSLGGEVDIDAIDDPGTLSGKLFNRIRVASSAGGGNPATGETVFLDICADCHIIDGEGGNTGPDLSELGKKGYDFIKESIRSPAAKITPGYETYLLVDLDGRKFRGIKVSEEPLSVDIVDENGTIRSFLRSDMGKFEKDVHASLMPEDLIDILTVREYQDLVSFLLLQKGDAE